MAKDIFRLFSDSNVFEKRIILWPVTEPDITFGHDMDEAVNILMQYIRKEK
jgi:hypothetical protein